MTKNRVSDVLKQLATETADRSTTARLRDVFDDIETALKAGVRRKAILETLQQEGFNMTLKSFESALYRIRKQRKKEGNKESANQQKPQNLDAAKEHANPMKSEEGLSPIKRSGLPIVQRKEINLEDFI